MILATQKAASSSVCPGVGWGYAAWCPYPAWLGLSCKVGKGPGLPHCSSKWVLLMLSPERCLMDILLVTVSLMFFAVEILCPSPSLPPLSPNTYTNIFISISPWWWRKANSVWLLFLILFYNLFLFLNQHLKPGWCYREHAEKIKLLCFKALLVNYSNTPHPLTSDPAMNYISLQLWDPECLCLFFLCPSFLYPFTE